MWEKQMTEFESLNLRAYAARFNDEQKLKESASGGVATALSEYVIGKGGVVFGVKYTEDFKGAEYYCARTLEQLKKLKGSKYIVSEKSLVFEGEKITVYEAVFRALSKAVPVLFVGLGCDVAGLVKYLEKRQADRTNLYIVDLICHGPTYSEIQKEFVENLEKKYKSKVVEFSVRYKHTGWSPRYVYARFENGKIFREPFFETDFGLAFKAYTRRSCYGCRFKGNQNVSDISIGDYWGCSVKSPSYSKWGVSLILARTEPGNKMLGWLTQNDGISVSDVDIKTQIDFAKNPAIYRNKKMNQADEVLYNKFKQNLENRGLHYAVAHTKGYSKCRKARIKRFIKKLVCGNLK